MYRRFALVGLLSCLAAMFSGCGGSSKMASVSGSVTFKGQPLPNAQVNFAPVNGGQIASGQTDSNGRFRLGTMSSDDGALVGKHNITIIARGPARPLRPGEIGSAMPGDLEPGDPIIPEKYFTPETSGLTHEVVKGQNTVNLELKE